MKYRLMPQIYQLSDKQANKSEIKFQEKSSEAIHNPEVVGSWPPPATLKIKELRRFRNSFFCDAKTMRTEGFHTFRSP